MLARAKKKGFTLLELIVVLLVIGILAAIAVPTYDAVKDNSAKRTLMSTAEGIARNANAMARSQMADNIQDTTMKDLNDAAAEAGLASSAPWKWTGTAAASRALSTGDSGVLTFDQGSRCFSVTITITDGANGDDDVAKVASSVDATAQNCFP